VNVDWAELVKTTSRVIDNAIRRWARRDLDKSSFESKAQILQFIVVVVSTPKEAAAASFIHICFRL